MVYGFHVSVEANPIVPPIVQMLPKKIAKFVSIVLFCTKPQLLLHIKVVLNGRRSSQITKGGSREWEGLVFSHLQKCGSIKTGPSFLSQVLRKLDNWKIICLLLLLAKHLVIGVTVMRVGGP